MAMTRSDLFRRLQVVRTVEPILDAQYRAEEEAIYRGEVMATERSESWHTSFHASSFPLDSALSCGRRAVYELMNLPPEGPLDPRFRAVMELGEDIEERIVQRFDRAGILIKSKDGSQINFTSKKFWLVGFADAIILPPGSNRPLPVEIKSTSDEKVSDMLAGKRELMPNHKAQVMTYTWFTKAIHEQIKSKYGSHIEPADAGVVIYFSRENPRKSAEFFVSFDKTAFQSGLKRLLSWQESFVAGVLPERHPDFMWSLEPCKWCPFKKACKADFKDNPTAQNLASSHAIERATDVNPNYEYLVARQKVLSRWGV